MLTIKVLGPGCANCKKLEMLTHQAINSLGVDCVIVKVTDYNEIVSYPIVSTPGLVINEQVVCSGRVPSQAEITTWITSAVG